MNRRIRLWPIAIALLLWPLAVAAAPTAEEATRAATLFGRALTTAKAADLAPILPGEGKVELRLVRLGPERGFFSPRQVEALFADFLREGKVTSFDVAHVEHHSQSYALALGRAQVIDREGRSARLELQIVLQPEGSRWVLREIRETPP